jgi:hypothetical protein
MFVQQGRAWQRLDALRLPARHFSRLRAAPRSACNRASGGSCG